jgi:hypothetical protein
MLGFQNIFGGGKFDLNLDQVTKMAAAQKNVAHFFAIIFWVSQ